MSNLATTTNSFIFWHLYSHPFSKEWSVFQTCFICVAPEMMFYHMTHGLVNGTLKPGNHGFLYVFRLFMLQNFPLTSINHYLDDHQDDLEVLLWLPELVLRQRGLRKYGNVPATQAAHLVIWFKLILKQHPKVWSYNNLRFATGNIQEPRLFWKIGGVSPFVHSIPSFGWSANCIDLI